LSSILILFTVMATHSRRAKRLMTEDPPQDATPQIDWSTFNHRDLVKATLTEDKAQQFAYTLGLLDYDSGPCPGKNNVPCGHATRLTSKKDQFRCTYRPCDKKISVRTATYFEGSNLLYSEILDHLYSSMTHMTQYEVNYESNMGSKTTGSNWASYLRELPSVVLANQPVQLIGGPGMSVEIDESHVRSRKYTTGRILKSEAVWAFGGICRETSECFVVPCQTRNANTLLPILQAHVAPGTTIYSDRWPAYGGINNLPEGYTHWSVNHSENFVDPDNDAIHTQTVERMWGCLKATLPRNLTDEQKGAYFTKFMYEKRFSWHELSTGQKFKMTCDHISGLYKVHI